MEKPLQLIKFHTPKQNQKAEAHIDSNVLQIVLNQCGDYPISVVCICGPARRGKSFLLGYMIRYLEALEKKQHDWMGHSNKSKPLTGFRFENKVDSLTKGIWVWSRPFIIPGKDQKPIAVLLIDTQGTGDEFTTETEMTTIVTLSLLLSSMMIFNFFTICDEKILAAFDTYIQYGLLAKEKDDVDVKPFQNIMFLIRDWNVPDPYPYGSKGGQEYLKELLKLKKDQPKETQRVRNSIKDCFQETSCFLMPFIGKDALKPTFTGSVSELDPEFAKHLEGFIGSYLSANNLVTKRFLGGVVTAQEIKSYLEKYVEIFNSGEIPDAVSVWEATVQATSGNLVGKALKSYVNGMAEVVTKVTNQNGRAYVPKHMLHEYHSKEKTKAQQLFNNARKFGSLEQCLEFEKQLIQLIHKEFYQLETGNEVKRRDYIARAEDEARKQLQMKLTETFPQNELENSIVPLFFEPDTISQFTENTLTKICDDFGNKFLQEKDNVRNSLVQKLKNNILDEIINTFRNENATRKCKAEENISALRNTLLSEYNLEMGGYLKKNEFVQEVDLKASHEKCKSLKIASFLSQIGANPISHHHHHHARNEYVEKRENELGLKLDKEYLSLVNTLKLSLGEMSSKTEEFLKKCTENHKQELDKYLASTCECLNELEKYHQNSASSVLNNFNQELNPYPNSRPEHSHYSEKLEKALNKVFESTKLKLEQNIRGLDDIYHSTINECAVQYKTKMITLLDKGAVSQEQLEECHVEQLIAAKRSMGNVQLGNQSEKLRQANLPRYLEELESAINTSFQVIQKDVAHKNLMAKRKATEWKAECENHYETLMKENVKTSVDITELQSLHEKAILSAGELLMEKVSESEISPDVSFDQLSSELEKELEAKWNEIKVTFENSKKLKKIEETEMLEKAQEIYKREMETHVQNNLNHFIHPDNLRQWHVTAKHIAISKVIRHGDDQNQREVISEIETELEKLYDYFRAKTENPVTLPENLGEFYHLFGEDENSFMNILKKIKSPSKLTPPQAIIWKYSGSAVLSSRPLNTVMIFMGGVSGSGKSTTINVLFEDANLCSTSSSTSETKEPVRLRKTLKVTRESPPVIGNLTFVDVPGAFDTNDENEVANFASIRKFRECSVELQPRQELEKLKGTLNLGEKTVYPNVILYVVRATDNRIMGPSSAFRKSLESFKLHDLFDKKKPNLIIVLSHSRSMGGSTEFTKLLAEKTKDIREITGEILGVYDVDVVPVENDGKGQDLRKRGDFYELPNGELSHYNLFQAMKKVFGRNGDLMGRLFAGWYFGTQCPEKKDKVIVDNSNSRIELNKKDLHLAEKELRQNNIFVNNSGNSHLTPQYNFQSLGCGFCPVTEEVKPVYLLSESGDSTGVETKVVEIEDSKFLIPDCINPYVRKASRFQRISFYEKDEYQNYMSASYGLEVGYKLIVSASSNGRWVSDAQGSYSSSLIRMVQEIQVATFKLDNPRRRVINTDLLQELSRLPTSYGDDTASEFRSFFSKWGTHIICEEAIGGAIQLNCTIQRSSLSKEKLQEIEGEVSAVFKGFSGSFNMEFQQLGRGLKSTGVSNETLEIEGGDPPQFMTLESPNSSQKLQEWAPTIPKTPVELRQSIKLYPYYNLLDNGPHCESLRKATMEYLQNTLSNRIEKIVSRQKVSEQTVDETAKAQGPSCFPKGTLVELWNGERKPIEQLSLFKNETPLKTIGFKANFPFKTKLKLEKVAKTNFCTFLDAKSTIVMEYLVLHFSNKKKLVVSESHMIFQYIPGKNAKQVMGKKAKYFKIGEMAVYLNADTQEIETPLIENVTREMHVGAYSPLTTSGTFFADGFLVSSYANIDSFQHAQMVMVPLKLWCESRRTTANNDEELNTDKRAIQLKEGIHPFAKFLMTTRKSITRLATPHN